ncbi:glutaminase A [Pseudalkalibacillus berkeleyi]|uniref:Glutaminase n=1 Tax=Pseudalkalibacillus berkeleyi TaxID=1069813 RepID=A0ABS9GVW6_9BACL|nr:glutaminase A [Pseudalkalibacillus berkeleyi]MCF6136963.1 glutaminase A [Pseudalkalibacillus berkeleyi]
MYCETDDELLELVERARKYTEKGKVASYIPALERANQNDLSIALYYDDGRCVRAGDVEKKFTLQSVSKVLTLALAIMDRGEEEVFSRVGMEPTGDPFNSIAKLETQIPAKPLNPMINAGALVVTNMIAGDSVHQKLGRLLSLIHDMTNNTDIDIEHEVAQSEYDTANLNRSLCFFMKQHGIIQGDVEELIDLYTKQCAIQVTCYDLARIGVVLANKGLDPQSNRRILPERIATIVKTFMVTCGMYNASGEFAIQVGVPSKSGVSGAILALVPPSIGVGVYGPALNEKGNSIGGVKLLEMLSQRYDLSIF